MLAVDERTHHQRTALTTTAAATIEDSIPMLSFGRLAFSARDAVTAALVARAASAA